MLLHLSGTSSNLLYMVVRDVMRRMQMHYNATHLSTLRDVHTFTTLQLLVTQPGGYVINVCNTLQ